MTGFLDRPTNAPLSHWLGPWLSSIMSWAMGLNSFSICWTAAHCPQPNQPQMNSYPYQILGKIMDRTLSFLWSLGPGTRSPWTRVGFVIRYYGITWYEKGATVSVSLLSLLSKLLRIWYGQHTPRSTDMRQKSPTIISYVSVHTWDVGACSNVGFLHFYRDTDRTMVCDAERDTAVDFVGRKTYIILSEDLAPGKLMSAAKLCSNSLNRATVPFSISVLTHMSDLIADSG